MVIFSLENLHLFYFPFRVSPYFRHILPVYLCIIKDTNQLKTSRSVFKKRKTRRVAPDQVYI